MSSDWQAALRGAISEVLETMFFMAVDFLNVTPLPGGHEFESRIVLTDGRGGFEVCFRVTPMFAAMITANLLGKEESEVQPEEIEDALKEFTNMAGGNFQGRMRKLDWEMDIPSFRILDAAAVPLSLGFAFEWVGEPMGVAAVFPVDGEGRRTP